MTVDVIVQLKMTDRAAYDRYQARFFDVFRKFSGRLAKIGGYHHGPKPNPKPNVNGAGA